MSIPLGKLGYLAPRVHRVLSESRSENLSYQNSIEAAGRTHVIGRCVSVHGEDAEGANLTARARRGTASIIRTSRGVVPTNVGETDLEEARNRVSPGSDSTNVPEGEQTCRPDGAGEAGPSGTRTRARSATREITYFDEVEGEICDINAKDSGNT